MTLWEFYEDAIASRRELKAVKKTVEWVSTLTDNQHNLEQI